MNSPLAKVFFATEITKKMSFKNFSQISLPKKHRDNVCALWLILPTLNKTPGWEAKP